MNAILILLNQVVSIYMYIVIAYVVLSWLISFNIISYSNPIVAQIAQVLRNLVEPVLRPIKDFLGKIGLNNLGGIDISPVILLLGLYFVQNLIRFDIMPALS